METSSTSSLPIQAALTFGWKIFKQRAGLLIGVTLLWLVLQNIPGLLQAWLDRFWMIAIVNIIFAAISMILFLGIVQISLKLYRQESVSFSDAWSQYRLLWPYFLANVVYGVIVFVGLLLFIVPGIIWSIRYFYFSYLMVEQHLKPMAALKKSAALTKGWTGRLFVFGLAQMLVVLLGFMALGVGILVAIPVVFLAEVYIYQFLLKNSAK